MDTQTTLTLRCSACGALAQASCNCGAPYLSPGNLAAKAVKDNPEKSNRAIADDLGIDESTVRVARKSTAGNPAVDEKRTGRDGKTRKMPKKRKNNIKQETAAASAVLDGANTLKQAAEAAGLGSVQGVKTGVAYELGRRDAYAEVGALADLFKMNAKQKLNAAIRAHKKLLDREYDQRRTKEIQEHIKRIMPTLQEEKNAAYRRERDYREYLQKAKKAMTVAEYTLVVSCLHPDSRISVSEERLRRAFQMFEPKKFALTGEK